MSGEEQKKELFEVPRKTDGSIDFDQVPDWLDSDCLCRKVYDTATVDGFSEAQYEEFKVRSSTYLKDQVKEDARAPMFRTVGLNIYNPNNKTYHISKWIPSLREYMETYAHVYSEFFIVNWQLPGPPHYNVVHAYGRVIPEGVDVPFDNAYSRFKAGDTAFRNARLKFFPSIVTGPWAVKFAANRLGGSRPCIIGKKLTATYNDGPNYIEVNINVGSSKIASSLNGIIVSSSKSLCVDEGFMIESQEQDELPERFIGLSRFIHCSLDNVKRTVTLPEDYKDEQEA